MTNPLDWTRFTQRPSNTTRISDLVYDTLTDNTWQYGAAGSRRADVPPPVQMLRQRATHVDVQGEGLDLMASAVFHLDEWLTEHPEVQEVQNITVHSDIRRIVLIVTYTELAPLDAS